MVSRVVLFLAAALAGAHVPAQPMHANDSMAGMGLGGLEFIRSEQVALREQFLHITRDRVRVRYVFRNESARAVDALVAFPLPSMGYGNDINYVPLPYVDSPNYVGFRTWIAGVEIDPNVESRAVLLGIDVTERLRELGVSLVPYGYQRVEAIAALPDSTRRALREEFLIDSNIHRLNTPLWTLETSFWRRQSFEPGVDVVVEHEYTPIRGGSVASPVGNTPQLYSGEEVEQARARYCVEDEMEAMMHRLAQDRDHDLDYQPINYSSSEVEYLLMPGGNWRGPIGHFRLVVEAPHPQDFVFMCEERAERVAPNRIEINEENFYPWRDLDILFAHRIGEGIERDDW